MGGGRFFFLTRTSAYAYLYKVIVAEVTLTIRGIPQEVALGKKRGFNARPWPTWTTFT